MYKYEREDELIALLEACEYATVEQLSEKIGISASSIRRDLKALEERGLVKRSYGGVKLVCSKQAVGTKRARERAALKMRFADAAHELLTPNQTIFLDSSDEAFFLAERLAEIGNFMIVTNSIDIPMLLSPYESIKVYSTGGSLSGTGRRSLLGASSMESVRRVHADVAICSADSMRPSGEFFALDSEEAALRALMFSCADQRVLLCDVSRWGGHAPFYQGSMDTVDVLITDRDPTHYFDDPTPSKYKVVG